MMGSVLFAVSGPGIGRRYRSYLEERGYEIFLAEKAVEVEPFLQSETLDAIVLISLKSDLSWIRTAHRGSRFAREREIPYVEISPWNEGYGVWKELELEGPRRTLRRAAWRDAVLWVLEDEIRAHRATAVSRARV